MFAALLAGQTAPANPFALLYLHVGQRLTKLKHAGADIVGAERLDESHSGGKIDFDRCIRDT